METHKAPILVTGCGGYIGTQLRSYLDQIGVNSIGQSRRVNGDNKNIQAFNLEDPTPELYDRLGRPETLIHLAWGNLSNYGSPLHYEYELPLHYNFLKKFVSFGVKRLVVTGTCLEYGKVNGCLKEDLMPNPSTPYGYAKDALRRQLEFLKMEIDYQLVWLRLFYIYGNRKDGKSILSQLADCISDGCDSFNMSLGEQLRDYLHVSKVSEYIALISLNLDCEGIFNVCSGMPISVRRLVEEYIAEVGVDIKLNLGGRSYSLHEPMAFWGDVEKLHKALKYE